MRSKNSMSELLSERTEKSSMSRINRMSRASKMREVSGKRRMGALKGYG